MTLKDPNKESYSSWETLKSKFLDETQSYHMTCPLCYSLCIMDISLCSFLVKGFGLCFSLVSFHHRIYFILFFIFYFAFLPFIRKIFSWKSSSIKNFEISYGLWYVKGLMQTICHRKEGLSSSLLKCYAFFFESEEQVDHIFYIILGLGVMK